MKLRARLKLISEFREQHEKLVNVLADVLVDQDNDITSELAEVEFHNECLQYITYVSNH